MFTFRSAAGLWDWDKDTGYLYNASGTRLDSCSYNNRSASSVYC